MTTGTSYTDRYEPHHRRRFSDSQASTTMSQMNILGPPASGRDQRTLSSITEERVSAMSFAMASPNSAPSLRVCFSPALRWYPRAVTDLCHRSPYNPTLMSSRQTLLPTTHLVFAFLPLAWNLPPSLHKSSSMSSDEYKFDIIPPVRISRLYFRMVWWFTSIFR